VVYLNVWLNVTDPADVDFIRDCLARCTALSRPEPGCHRYEVYHSQADRQKFLLVEQWADKAAWEAHRTRAAYLEIYQPKVIPKVTRTPHLSDLLEPVE